MRRSALRLCAGLLLALSAGALQAGAQDKPRPRPQPIPQPSDTTATSNSLSDPTRPDAPAAQSPLPTSPVPAPPGSPTLRPQAPAPPPLVLRSAVHSRYSRTPVIARNTAGQCRAQCAVTRTQCAAGESDASGCDPAWTQCLSTCDGLSYARGP